LLGQRSLVTLASALVLIGLTSLLVTATASVSKSPPSGTNAKALACERAHRTCNRAAWRALPTRAPYAAGATLMTESQAVTRSSSAEHLSAGRVRLATGTLYTALDRLTAEGYVELVSEEIVNGRARRSYGLTPPGAGALRAEAERMAAATSLVADRGQSPKTVPSARKVSPA
jgi:hypothetical protein